MVIGIAGGLVMLGLILGAISGSIWLLLGFASAGFLVAAASAAIQQQQAQAASSRKLAQYPPYGY